MPQRVYKKQWKNWGSFLGTNYIATFNRKYPSLKKIKKIVREKKITSAKDYSKSIKSGVLPSYLPHNPDTVLKNKGWVNWGEFLGTGKIANQKRKYLSFVESKKKICEFKLSSNKDYLKMKRLKKLGNEFPTSPDNVYRERGWKGWPDFLGKKTKS